jgi:cytochrome c peroxidase
MPSFGLSKSILVITSLLYFSCNNEVTTPGIKPNTPTAVEWKQPAHFPESVYDFSNNTLTEEAITLGRYLFYDGRLSRTNMIGCGTCHQQPSAFTHHGHELSHGVDDLLGTRNAPAIQNVAWQQVFFWDGGVHDLDFVPFNPIGSAVEMDENVPSIIEKLQLTQHETDKKKPNYPQLFQAAYGTPEITSTRMMKALSQFMLTMVSSGSRYDYYRQGDTNALTAQEKRGLTTFTTHCGNCHTGELFTDQSFRNNGLQPLKIDDKGREEVTGEAKDRYKFKVPSLRNVGLTAPYMHDGRYYTLQEVLDHYTRNVQNTPNLDTSLVQASGQLGIPLTSTEKQDIIAFLHTLSDDEFTKDQRLSDPGIGNAL